MPALQWKKPKSTAPGGTQWCTSTTRSEKPSRLAFVNIETPQQLTNPDLQREVRRHVVQRGRRIRRRDNPPEVPPAVVAAALSGPATAPTYLGSVQICDHFKRIFQSLGLSDQGALHLAIDDGASDFSRLTPTEQSEQSRPNSVDSMRRYTHSLGTVRSRMVHTWASIERNQAMGTAICLAFYDMRVGSFRRWTLHMDGVLQMTSEAGGLELLESFTFMREALFMADVVGSLVFNTEPKFPPLTAGAMLYQPAMPPPVSTAMEPTFLFASGSPPTLGILTNSLYALFRLSEKVSRSPPATSIYDSAELARELFTIAHSLLALPKLSSGEVQSMTTKQKQAAAMREAVRQAALVSVSCVLTTSSGDDIYCARRRNGRIRRLLVHAGQKIWQGMGELRLWILVVGALIEGPDDRAWLLYQAVSMMRCRGLRSWGDLTAQLRRIAWSDALAIEEAASIRADLEYHLTQNI